jgi:hypothetical protein
MKSITVEVHKVKRENGEEYVDTKIKVIFEEKSEEWL